MPTTLAPVSATQKTSPFEMGRVLGCLFGSIATLCVVIFMLHFFIAWLFVAPVAQSTPNGSNTSVAYTPDPTFATRYTTLNPTKTEPDGTVLVRVPLCEITKKGTINKIELTLEYAPIQHTTPENCPSHQMPALFVSRGTTHGTDGQTIGFQFTNIKPERGFRTLTFAGLSWDVRPGDKLFFGAHGCASQQYGATVQARTIKIIS